MMTLFADNLKKPRMKLISVTVKVSNASEAFKKP